MKNFAVAVAAFLFLLARWGCLGSPLASVHNRCSAGCPSSHRNAKRAQCIH